MTCVCRASRSVERHAGAEGRHDVLPLAERHLELRHDVPSDDFSVRQVLGGDEFDHRRPRAAEWPWVNVFPPTSLQNTSFVSPLVGTPRPACAWMKPSAGSACPNARKPSTVVCPLPKPRSSFPVGSATSTAPLRIVPLPRLWKNALFAPNATSPMSVAQPPASASSSRTGR